MLTPNVLENLKKYEEHQDGRTCLECGYTGLMGIKSTGRRPFFSTFTALVITIFAAIAGISGLFLSAIIFGVALGTILQFSARPVLSCPNCSADLA